MATITLRDENGLTFTATIRDGVAYDDNLHAYARHPALDGDGEICWRDASDGEVAFSPSPAPQDDPRYPTQDELIAIAAAFWDRYCQEPEMTLPTPWEALSGDGKASRVLELAQYAAVLADLGFEVVRVTK